MMSRSVSFCQAALPSGAAPIHPSPTPSTPRERVLLGPTPCSRTTRSSVSACARHRGVSSCLPGLDDDRLSMVISWASTSFVGGYVSFNDVVDEQMVNSGGGEKNSPDVCFWCQMVLFDAICIVAIFSQ